MSSSINGVCEESELEYTPQRQLHRVSYRQSNNKRNNTIKTKSTLPFDFNEIINDQPPANIPQILQDLNISNETNVTNKPTNNETSSKNTDNKSQKGTSYKRLTKNAICISKEMIDFINQNCVEYFNADKFHHRDDTINNAEHPNDEEIDIHNSSGRDVIILNIDLHFRNGEIMYLIGGPNEPISPWKIDGVMKADKINKQFPEFLVTQDKLPKSIETESPDSFLEDCYYSARSCPITLILRNMSNKYIDIHMNICDKLFDENRILEQCQYLRRAPGSNVIEVAAKDIQQQFGLEQREIDALVPSLETYYNIYYINLHPTKTIDYFFVFVGNVISVTIDVGRHIDNVDIWKSEYFLFEFVKQFEHLKSYLLSFPISKLASILTQNVAREYSGLHPKSINAKTIKTLERVLKSCITMMMKCKSAELIKPLKSERVIIDTDVTEMLMTRPYIAKCFPNAKELFSYLLYTIKIQQIDGSYATFENIVRSLVAQTIIFSSRIMHNDQRMYIVVIQIDGQWKVNDLVNPNTLKQLFTIQKQYLPITVNDLLQRREEKLLYGFIRQLSEKEITEIIDIDLFRLCQTFFRYQNNFHYKQSIYKLPTEAPIQLIFGKNKHSNKEETIFEEDILKCIQDALKSDDCKCECFRIILLSKKMDTYYPVDVVPVCIGKGNWIYFFPRSNEFSTDSNFIRRQRRLYEISFDECKQWKNDINILQIKTRRKGVVEMYDCYQKYGSIRCVSSNNMFSFFGEQFLIDDDSMIKKGINVYFYKLSEKDQVKGQFSKIAKVTRKFTKKMAINIKPV